MNQLEVINQEGQLLVDSREVSKMTEVRHGDLLRTIAGYIQILENAKLRFQDFFIPSTYKVDGNNKTYDHFYLTRKGCDMVANKMTGEKGVLFTAEYVSRFEEMEKQLAASAVDIAGLSPILQLMIQNERRQALLEQQQKETAEQVAVIKEVFVKRDENWRKMIDGMIKGAAYHRGGDYRELRNQTYRLLEERGHCKLGTRLINYKQRLADSGATKTRIEAANKMDIIEEEPRLKEIYTMIVKEITIGATI